MNKALSTLFIAVVVLTLALGGLNIWHAEFNAIRADAARELASIADEARKDEAEAAEAESMAEVTVHASGPALVAAAAEAVADAAIGAEADGRKWPIARPSFTEHGSRTPPTRSDEVLLSRRFELREARGQGCGGPQ